MEQQIDILLATYNGEKYLIEQIESILNQTYKNFRLIISDDGSKDLTRQIIKEYEQRDNRIVSYFQENNLGYIKNFEFLLTKVENEIYMLSDQDDVWLPNKIEKTYNKLKQENADLVFTDLEVVDKNLNTIFKSFNDYMLLTRKIEKYHKNYIMQYLYNCVTGCTLMSKKKFIDMMIPLPYESKHVVHDLWIGLTVALNGKIAYLNETTIKYRQHGNNQIGTNKISHGFNKLDQVRNHFINIKIELFTAYVKYDSIFPKILKEQNKKALSYFEDIKNKKYFNFKNWKTFHRLYKYDTFKYYILNFIIMNLPAIGRVLFAIRYNILKILKILKKR